jgi:hypothetical protein
MPTPTYDLIATTTLAATNTEVVFGSLPQTYRDLIVVVNTEGLAGPNYRVNGDSGANYSYVSLRNSGNTAMSEFGTISVFLGQNATATSNTRVINIFQLMDYSATNKHKTGLVRGGYTQNSNGAFVTEANAVRWANTAAVTSLTILSSTAFGIGSTFNLYGIAA